MAQPTTFKDEGHYWVDFAQSSLVVCPQCACCASVNHIEGEPGFWRFVCSRCGLVKEDHSNPFLHAGGPSMLTPTDPVFKFSLWLQTPCCGETLWAFSGAHIAWLESYVSAQLRQGRPLDQDAALARNATMASRLPKWIIAAKNREEVLKGTARLREKLS